MPSFGATEKDSGISPSIFFVCDLRIVVFSVASVFLGARFLGAETGEFKGSLSMFCY
jgi:hypothetical protein